MSFHCTSMAVGLLNSLLSSFAREVRAAFSVESGFRRDSLSCFSAPANTRVALVSFPLDLASRSVETNSTGWTNVGGRGVHVWVCEDVGVWEECVVCIWQVKFHSQTPICMKSQGMRLQCTLHITYAWEMCVCVCMCASCNGECVCIGPTCTLDRTSQNLSWEKSTQIFSSTHLQLLERLPQCYFLLGHFAESMATLPPIPGHPLRWSAGVGSPGTL